MLLTGGQLVVPFSVRLIGHVSLWPCQLVRSSTGFTAGEISLVMQWKFACHADCGAVIPP